MVTKEIKQFVITQMKEADWELDKNSNIKKYKSKHIYINHITDISQKVTFIINIPTGYSNNEFSISRKELNLNYFHFIWLLIRVKKSCRLVDERKRHNEISWNWNKFLEKNKDLNRDNKINQIID